MKYLILILVVVVVLMLLGAKKRTPRVSPRPEEKKVPTDAAPSLMVSCAQCGLHLPRAEALPGRGGEFCSAAHRSQFEARHPQA